MTGVPRNTGLNRGAANSVKHFPPSNCSTADTALAGKGIQRSPSAVEGSANILLDEFARLRKAFWGRHLWARRYFCFSGGDITVGMVKAYMEEDDDFKLEEGAQ